MIRKSLVAKGIALATAAVLLAGCTSGGSPDGKTKTEITFLWLWGESEDQVLRELVTEFNDSQDEIHVTGVSSPDTVKQLAAMTSSNGTFDVSDYFGNATASWADKGILEPLDEYIQRDGFDLSDFIAPALEQNQYDGKTYALPISTIVLQLYYNKRLLAEAGYDGPPTTLEELGEMTRTLTKTDDAGKITQLGLWGPWSYWNVSKLAEAFGGSLFGLGNGADGPNPNNPGAHEALDFYNENVLKPFGADKIAEFTSGFGAAFTSDYPLYSEKVAMAIDGAYHNAQIPTYAPDLDYGVVSIPVPAARPDLEGTTSVDNSSIIIPANSKHKDAAWEFVKFLFKKDNVYRFNKSQTNLPPYVSGVDSPVFDDLPEGFHAFLQALKSPNLVASPAQPWNPEYSNELGVIADDFTSGRATVADAMKRMEDAASKFQP